jgi:uncharacterized protein (DUF1330 family)
MVKLVFALKITDEIVYAAYRAAIKPLLDELGVQILNEYRISEVIHSKEATDEVDIVAMFGFPSEESKKLFFSSETYKNAKRNFFYKSTANFTRLVE